MESREFQGISNILVSPTEFRYVTGFWRQGATLNQFRLSYGSQRR